MRIFLVSNRVAVPGPDQEVHAGGLEVALRSVQERYRCVWIGWSGDVVEENPNIRHVRAGNTDFILTDLPRQEYEEYYNGFANRVLWPVLHYRQDLAEFSRQDLGGYLRVNRRFAEILMSQLTPKDVVWVHDYHFMPLAQILRELGCTNRIGFFLHIPMPPPEVVAAMPGHQRVVGALAAYDLVGMQTGTDVANFARYLAKRAGTTPHFGLNQSGRRLRLQAFPVGIETERFQQTAAESADTDLAQMLRQTSANLAIGVDRLDYSKGLDLKFDAFGRFLRANRQWCDRITFLQITPKSRSAIAEYASMETQLATMSGRINSEFGNALWTPVRYVTRPYPREALAGFFRIARVGIVTPLRDGMNLVAKEFVAAQDPQDPGVLVLSEFAGAASEMDDALLVNPNDPEAVAAAIGKALEMPLSERRMRQERLWKALLKTDIAQWSERFLKALIGKGTAGDAPELRYAAE